MHLLYCDESNIEERSGDFLIYGGLMIGPAEAHDLSLAIDKLREDAKVPRDYRLKFNPGPEGMDHVDFVALKQAVFEIAAAHGVKLIVYVILHDIATDPDTARRNGINAVCFHFDCILRRRGGPGLVLIDRFNDEGNRIDGHLRDKFSIGLTGLPYAREMRLERIVGFHTSAIGQSHFPSLVDIVLGSLRFAINAHTRNDERFHDTARTVLRLIEPLLWRERENQPVSELSFLFSPKVINFAPYRKRYDDLKQFLAEAGVDTEQPITPFRMY